MKKEILRSALLFAALEIFLFSVFLLQNSHSALFCFVLVILITAATFCMNFFVKGKLSAKAELPVTAEKGKNVVGKVVFKNNSPFPVLNGICEVEIKNRLTSENIEEVIKFSVSPKGKTEAEFFISSDFCGYVTANVKHIYLMDIFGFIPLELKNFSFAKGKMTVLPETFLPLIVFGGMLPVPEDSESYSPDKKGNDFSETFQIREYAPGDSIKQIHWKLSEKLDKTIVRDPSLPIAKNIMLYWDKTSGKASPAEMDAMAEVISSVAQSLCRSGYEFVLGWNDGNRNENVRITSDEDLLEAIPRLIKYCPFDPEEEENENVFENFGEVICVAKQAPSELLDKVGASILVCDKTTVGRNVITFDEKNYSEDLEFLEFGI